MSRCDIVFFQTHFISRTVLFYAPHYNVFIFRLLHIFALALFIMCAILLWYAQDGRTALMWASADGRQATVQVLVDAGTDRDARDKVVKTRDKAPVGQCRYSRCGRVNLHQFTQNMLGVIVT